MSKHKELIKNTFIIFLGKGCTQFISFLLLPLYTAYLTTSDYGIVDLIISYVSLFVPVITVQLEMAAFRFLVDNRNNNEMISKIITNVLYSIVSFAILFSIGYIVLTSFINVPYKWYILFNILATILSNLVLQIARGMGDNKTYSIGSFITGAITIVNNVIFIVCLKVGAKGMLLSSIIANFICFIYIAKKLKMIQYINYKQYDQQLIKKALRYSWPLVPNGICWWIINASDRTIISYFLDISANGIYAVSNKFSGIISMIVSIFSLSWTESASLHIEDKDRDEFFSNIINTVVKILTSIVLVVIAVMPFAFHILIHQQYEEAYLYIPILLLSTIFNGIVILYSGIYIAKKLTKQVAVNSMVSSILNIVINLLLIRLIGLYAAAISTMLSYMIMAIYRHYDLRKYVKIKYEKAMIIKTILIYVIIISIYYIKMDFLNVIGLAIAILYVLIFNRDIIKICIDFVKNKWKSLS